MTYQISNIETNIMNLIQSIKEKFDNRIAIDLGTANTLVYAQGIGLVLNEPSIVAMMTKKGYEVPYLFGSSAKQMLGKTPVNISVYRPLKDGVVADFNAAECMIKEYLSISLQKIKKTFAKPIVIVCVPLDSTSVERRAIQGAVEKYGVKDVFLIEEPMAAAIGAGLPVSEPIGSVVIDIGGGTSEIATISLGGIVHGKSVKIGGNKIDEDIVNYIRQEYGLLLGTGTAEKIKKTLGSAYVKPGEEVKTMAIRGRDAKTGSPKEIIINQNDTMKAMQGSIKELIQSILETLEAIPPELASDIVDRGIVLTGGGANIKNLDYVISQNTSLPVFTAPYPLLSVTLGTAKVLERYEQYSHILFKQN